MNKEIINHNNDQKTHEIMFQKNILEFCNKILVSAVEHDLSKWSEKEYETFVNARSSLRGSKTGKDKDYQKTFLTEAVQHHVLNNPHHPEYWDRLDKPMPVQYVIEMFFDWYSRCQQKGTPFNDFWDYNLSKLSNQPHAKVIVECLKRDICDE